MRIPLFSSSLLAHRAFRDLWLAGAISRFGDALYFLGFPYIVLKMTGDPAMVGYVGALEALPFLFVGPYGGALADRLDRRRIMAISDVASAAILGLFALGVVACGGHPPVTAFLLSAFALSCARAVFMPAKNAAVPNVVPESELVRANAFTMGTDQAIWLGSLALSGSVLAALYAFSQGWFLMALLAVNGASFLGSAFFVARLPRLVPERATVHHPVQEIRDGLAYVRTRPELALLMSSQLGVTLGISPFFTVYLATNDRWFGGRADRLAWIEIAFVGAMLVVSLLVTRFKLRRVGYAWSLGIALCGVMVAVMGLSPVYGLFFVWNFIAGFGIGFVDIPVSTYMQATVPDEFRGRVMSLRMLCFTAPGPLAMVAMALVLPRLGLTPAYLLMGGAMAVSGLLPLLSRRFRAAEIPESAVAGSAAQASPELLGLREPEPIPGRGPDEEPVGTLSR